MDCLSAFCLHSGHGQSIGGYNMKDDKSFSTTDMVNGTDQGVIPDTTKQGESQFIMRYLEGLALVLSVPLV